jgi:hypothetical protein
MYTYIYTLWDDMCRHDTEGGVRPNYCGFIHLQPQFVDRYMHIPRTSFGAYFMHDVQIPAMVAP